MRLDRECFFENSRFGLLDLDSLWRLPLPLKSKACSVFTFTDLLLLGVPPSDPLLQIVVVPFLSFLLFLSASSSLRFKISSSRRLNSNCIAAISSARPEASWFVRASGEASVVMVQILIFMNDTFILKEEMQREVSYLFRSRYSCCLKCLRKNKDWSFKGCTSMCVYTSTGMYQYVKRYAASHWVCRRDLCHPANQKTPYPPVTANDLSSVRVR